MHRNSQQEVVDVSVIFPLRTSHALLCSIFLIWGSISEFHAKAGDVEFDIRLASIPCDQNWPNYPSSIKNGLRTLALEGLPNSQRVPEFEERVSALTYMQSIFKEYCIVKNKLDTAELCIDELALGRVPDLCLPLVLPDSIFTMYGFESGSPSTYPPRNPRGYIGPFLLNRFSLIPCARSRALNPINQKEVDILKGALDPGMSFGTSALSLEQVEAVRSQQMAFIKECIHKINSAIKNKEIASVHELNRIILNTTREKVIANINSRIFYICKKQPQLCPD